MKNIKSTDEKLVFSCRIEKVYEDLLARLKPNRIREMTETGPEPNGKTPFLDVFEKFSDAEPYEVCLAKAIVNSWLVSPVLIYPNEAVVGVPRPKYPRIEHFSWGVWTFDGLFDHPAYCDRKDELRERYHKLQRIMEPFDSRHMNDYGNKIFGEQTYYKIRHEGLWDTGNYQGHTVPDYGLLLELGIDGLLSKIERYAEKPKDERAANLYRASAIIIKGLSDYALLYAETAAKLADRESDSELKKQYLEVAENCRSIAHDKPKTLYQAAQLMWFYCLWDWVDCVGRADRYLLRFYRESEAHGDVISSEDTLCAVMLKMLEHGVHNITVGGVNPDGSDETNDVTFLILQILRRIHDTHPRVSVRFHKDSPKELMNLVTKIWSEGMSDPSVVSDSNVIDGLVRYGVPIEDARDYSMLGCQEIEIPGKSNFGCEDGMMNLAKVFEYALRDGKNKDGYQIGLQTGKLSDFSTFEDFYNAYKKQLSYFTEHFVALCNAGQEIRIANYAKLVKTPLTSDCIERGVPHDAGGTRYNFGVVETCGASAVGDSLYTLKELVFEKKLISTEKMMMMLDCDYAGFEEERQMILKLPKFGNDNEEADKMTASVLEFFWSEIAKYRSVRGDVFLGACSLLEGGIYTGMQTGALPDGHHAGEPLGNSIGPRPGTDSSGVTALFNSVARLPLLRGIGGTTLNVVLSTKMLENDNARAAVGDAVIVYLENGGQMAQITTANLNDLIDAQKNPELHKDLIIRIGGFSIQFVQLNLECQNEIISRYS